jgi:OmpA-OmpF porin, OOP family
MKNRFRIFIFLLGTVLSSQSRAGETYNANDIVKFFDQQKQMLVTRGICVGTESECAAEDVKDRKSAFDLLINFEKNSAELDETARENLMEFSIALKNPKLAALRFAVDGFTDASGNDDHNLSLSQRRSSSVVAFLQNLGVDESVLVPRGWGETNFRSDNELDPVNRRVETRLLK